jgi:hypothetical protein
MRSLLLLLLSFSLVTALKHDLKIRNDNRKRFLIENFGFNAGGQLHMTIKDFKVGGKELTAEYAKKLGFLIKRTDTDTSAFAEETIGTDVEKCLALLLSPGSTEDTIERKDTVVVFVEPTGKPTKYNKTIKANAEGFYNTYFINCIPSESVSFELELIQFNVDLYGNRNYLPVGLFPLPLLYGMFTIAYFIATIVWLIYFVRGNTNIINRVHHLMTVLMVLKLLSLMFHSIEYHYVQTTGSGGGWRITYYIFAGLKGIMLFILIALIGTGWSFIKPFLSDKDKKIFLVVIPLQILDNIAMIIIEETAPGSQKWFTWKDIFRLVDIICCGAILVPIIWSIKHLREASQIDGKAARNLHKLKLFRQFYLMVVSYIYFTRIIVYLVDATLPYKLVWLGDFFTELATIIFFSVVGYKFRPAPQNPYFALGEEEQEEMRQLNSDGSEKQQTED